MQSDEQLAVAMLSHEDYRDQPAWKRAIEGLLAWWCKSTHRLGHPMHGVQRCLTCDRTHPVCWEER